MKSLQIVIKRQKQQMILGYNWQILDYPIPKQQSLSKYVVPPKLSASQLINGPESLNSTMQPISLKSPIFSFVISYIIEDPKNNQPEIHVFPQMTLFENKIEISLLQERKQKNSIYQLIKVENCQCFETILTFVAKIKYIEGSNSKITSIDKLINLVGSRKLNSHSFQTYCSIKKQLLIEQPVLSQIRYSSKGYIIIKLTRSEEFTSGVWIQKVENLTWLCKDQKVKSFESKNLCKNEDKFKLNPKQSYSIMFTLPQNLKDQFELPLSISFSFQSQKQQKFKIIKYLKIE